MEHTHRLSAFNCVAVAFAAFSLLTGCTCGGGVLDPDGPDGGDVAPLLVSIALSPETATITARGGQPARQAYTVQGTMDDGTVVDVTSQAELLAENRRLGAFFRNEFVSGASRGGTSKVTAKVGTLTATATVNVRLENTSNDGSATLPPNGHALFTGAPVDERAPLFVYPNDGVMLPPNLGKLEFHFKKVNAANTLFELSFSNTLTDVKVLLRCTPLVDGCMYLPSPAVWTWIAETNRGGEPLSISLRATDDSGTAHGVSRTIKIQFAPEDVRGAIYYWSTTHKSVFRYDFAGLKDEPEKFFSPADTGDVCVGCHSLSRDGRKNVSVLGGGGDARLVVNDVATKANVGGPSAAGRSTFNSWNPDGTAFVGVYHGGGFDAQLHLHDGVSAQLRSSIAGTGTIANPATHPDWSADGSKIAYAQGGLNPTYKAECACSANWKYGKGSIRMVRQGGATWSAPETVVPSQSGKNRYYPAFSPDNAVLIYNESTCDTGEYHVSCNSYADLNAKLWAATPVASSKTVELARANAKGVLDPDANLSNSFPKWSPFVFQGSEPGSKLMWLTFSSSRRYGLRSVLPQTVGNEGLSSYLWMVAVDPAKVTAALPTDPSYAAFAIPFQALDSSNHIAQWTTEVVDNCGQANAACGDTAACCAGYQCVNPASESCPPGATNCACVEIIGKPSAP
jgi:hypothetical protein